MNWDIKEIHNYNEYMQKYSIHSLLAKIFAQENIMNKMFKDILQKRLIYHDFSLFLDADLVLDRITRSFWKIDEKNYVFMEIMIVMESCQQPFLFKLF